MHAVFIWIQIILSVLLGLAILLQSKGDGFGSMGGATTDEASEVYSTKRGAEKVLERATIILAVLFSLNAVLFPFFAS
jgi:protein translocase SecG subunit